MGSACLFRSAHRAAYAAVLESMRKVEFREEEISDVRILLAAVLLIGDIVRPPVGGLLKGL